MTPDYHTHPDWAALCRKIGERPDDDTVRLVAADWLEEHSRAGLCEECVDGWKVSRTRNYQSDDYSTSYSQCPACHGSGRVSDGRAERAEFIRVQCEIATRLCGTCRGCNRPISDDRLADGCPCNSPRGVNHGVVPAYVCTCPECDPAETGSVRERPADVQALHTREREVWPTVGSSFRPADDWDAHYDPACSGPTKFALVKRGFVATVRGPLAALLDALPGLGAELWAVEMADASDTPPWHLSSGGRYIWWDDDEWQSGDFDATGNLPTDLFAVVWDRFPAERVVTGHRSMRFRTEADARVAISAGILRLARERAGLERPNARAGA